LKVAGSIPAPCITTTNKYEGNFCPERPDVKMPKEDEPVDDELVNHYLKIGLVFLVNQGAKSYQAARSDPKCLYRSEAGSCFAGAFISDEHYRRAFEGSPSGVFAVQNAVRASVGEDAWGPSLRAAIRIGQPWHDTTPAGDSFVRDLLRSARYKRPSLAAWAEELEFSL
jgi:hypothetical protein